MKKILFLSIAVLGIAALSFKISLDKTTATTEKLNGVQVFCYSKPVGKYDILGMVKIKGIVKSEKGNHMVGLLAEKATKDYPSGEGIIISVEFDRAEVIKFKD